MTGVEAMTIVHKAHPTAELKEYPSMAPASRYFEVLEGCFIVGNGNTHRDAWLDCLTQPTVIPHLIAYVAAHFELYNLDETE